MNGLRFEDWLRRVDAWVGQLCGLGLDDLPDVPSRDWFEDGMGAKAAARKAVRLAGADF